MIKIIFFMVKEIYESKFTLALTLLIGGVTIMIAMIIIDNFNAIMTGASVV